MSKLRYLQGPAADRGPAPLNNTVRGIRATYETDPQVARAMLPQPLVGLENPEVFVQMVHVAMHVSAERTVEIGALTMGINCTYEGNPGAYCFHMAMEGESVVTSGRERYGEPKKIADTTFEKNGDHVKATCTRHGITYFEIEGDVGEAVDRPLSFEEHIYCYKGLPSITTPGEFDGDVFLTRLNWEREYKLRKAMNGKITLRESAYDPLVDIPVRNIISMDYVEGSTKTSGNILCTVPGSFIADHWVGRMDDPTNLGIDAGAVAAEAA